MTRAFAPVLGRNGGGAISTFSVRLELAEQGTQVLGLHLAASDTDMMAGWDVPTTSPELVIRTALDGLEAGRMEVLVDEFTRESKFLPSSPPERMYPGVVLPRGDWNRCCTRRR